MFFSKRFFLAILAVLSGLISLPLVHAGAATPTRSPAIAGRTPPAARTTQKVPQAASVPELRMLTLDFPPNIRLGDSDLVRLDFSIDSSGNPTSAISSSGQPAQAQIGGFPNAYENYTVLAEARLDMAGAAVNPPGLVSEPLLPGRTATFFWNVRPNEVGTSRGTVWFYLHFIPKTNAGQESRRAISAQDIEIQSDSLFGIQAGPARWLGVAGIFISLLLGLPLLDDAQKRLRRRPKTREADPRRS